MTKNKLNSKKPNKKIFDLISTGNFEENKYDNSKYWIASEFKHNLQFTNNTKFGTEALDKQKVPTSNNSAFGFRALKNSTEGIHQTAFGKNTLSKSSGNSNTAFGTESGTSITKGKRNTLIGNSTDISEENGLSQLVIGYGAKGHGNYIGVLGGSNTNEKSSKQTALKSIVPSLNYYTNLGSSDYKYKEFFVNKLNTGIDSYTLPKQNKSDINGGDFLNSDDNGQLSIETLNKFKGFYVERTSTSKTNQTIISGPVYLELLDGNVNNVASISVDDIINSEGRIYLDANTTNILFTSTAADFIKKLGLTKDYDFTSNLYIYTKASSDLDNIDQTFVATIGEVGISLQRVRASNTNITFSYFLDRIYDIGGNNSFSNNSTRLVIRRLTSSSIQIEFTA